MSLLANLNPQQMKAVTHGDGPQLVLAGAGSGKTRVITHRIAWLVEECGVAPANVVAVTFTNKAASEMVRRVETLLPQGVAGLAVGTFHRFCLRLLRAYSDRLGLRRGFVIFDDSDQMTVVRRALEMESLDDGAFPPRSMLARISDAKSRLLTPRDVEAEASGFFDRRLARVFTRYEAILRRSMAVDFDDLIVLAVRLLREQADVADRLRRRYRYLLVDEFQDTNVAQLELVSQLSAPAANVTAVGDEDQSIYSWRGARVENILEFERHFPGAEVRRLEQNYRSTQNILDASGAVVSNNRGRRGKTLWTDAGAGELLERYVARDESDEANWVVSRISQLRGGGSPLDDIAILVRTNAQTRVMEEELLRREIPYSLIGGVRFYERAEVKDLIAYLRVLHDPRDEMSMRRIINRPARGIGATSEKLAESEARHLKLSFWDYLSLDHLPGLPPRGSKALLAFRDLVTSLRDEIGALAVGEALERVIEATDYTSLFAKQDAESRQRLENVKEFLSAAHAFAEETEAAGAEGLTAFLDHIALVTDLDGWQRESGVSLMTLHSAKGLEFESVLIAGVEDGLLPHHNSRDTEAELEEERRLFYVGMTRAGRRLCLSSARRRRVAGRYQDQEPSPFLDEIPTDLVSVETSPTLYEGRAADEVRAFFRGGGADREARRPAQRRDGGALRKGKRVRHAKLGEGVVLSAQGDGDGAKITVFFERAGKRTLLAKIARLEVL